MADFQKIDNDKWNVWLPYVGYLIRIVDVTAHGFLMAHVLTMITQIAKFMRPTWDPSGSCRPQAGPTLAPWTLLSWKLYSVIKPLIPIGIPFPIT